MKYSNCERCSMTIYYRRRSRRFCDDCRYKHVAESLRNYSKTSQGHQARVRSGQGNRGRLKPGRSGDRHPFWKGDQVGYAGIHSWVRKHGEDSGSCGHCGATSKPLDWANISQEYKRDLKDWVQLCRSCHVKYDNRLGSRWSRFKAPNPIRFKREANHV